MAEQFKIQNFRKRHPRFIYQKYFYKIKKGDLKISFVFKIEPDIQFRPKIIIKDINQSQISQIGEGVLNNLIFHLGLIEILSYWKATCSSKIVIEAGYLNKEQIKWWKDLIINGMGQFFYENKINWTRPNFLKISGGQGKLDNKRFGEKLKNRYLVPFAGGRDSIVTLERLKKPIFAKASAGKQKKEVALFLVNPSKQIQKTVRVAGIKKQIIVKREIDTRLLKLNKKGYLNGHTPFTALLSFLTVFCAILFDYKHIVFSNEKSADEGNVKYLGRIINHQWAKSSEFEKMFKDYCKKYLARDINYFSFLRTYTELEISKMFTKYPEYFPVFSSCNAGMKIGAKQIRWCGNCPKCLFAYLTLYPFLDKKQLLKIFGKDLFKNKELLPTMRALIGEGKTKPFECVGTYQESKKAFELSLKKALGRSPMGEAKKSGKIPYLLGKI